MAVFQLSEQLREAASLVVSPQVMRWMMAVSLTASVVMGCATMPRSMVGALIDQAPIPETESASEAVAKDSPGSQSPFGSVDG